MAIYQRGKFLRYRFRFAGKQIDESTKTIAREAERKHRRALEAGYNNFKELRENRVRVLQEIIDEYLVGYRLRYRYSCWRSRSPPRGPRNNLVEVAAEGFPFASVTIR